MKSLGEWCGQTLQTSRGRDRASNRCYCAQDWNFQLPTLIIPVACCHASPTWWTLIPLEPKFRYVVQHSVPPWVLSSKIPVSPLLCHSPGTGVTSGFAWHFCSAFLFLASLRVCFAFPHISGHHDFSLIVFWFVFSLFNSLREDSKPLWAWLN